MFWGRGLRCCHVQIYIKPLYTALHTLSVPFILFGMFLFNFDPFSYLTVVCFVLFLVIVLFWITGWYVGEWGVKVDGYILFWLWSKTSLFKKKRKVLKWSKKNDTVLCLVGWSHWVGHAWVDTKNCLVTIFPRFFAFPLEEKVWGDGPWTFSFNTVEKEVRT